jgi:predicted transcriptional regulator
MDGELAGSPRAGTLLHRDVPTCSLADRIGDIEMAMKRAGWDLCVVVNKEQIVLGLLWFGALKAASEAVEARAEDVMQLGPPTIRPDLPPEQALEYMKKRNTVLVTTSDGELLGVLRREDAERALE